MPTGKENKGKVIKNKRMSKKKIVGIALAVIIGFFVIVLVAASTYQLARCTRLRTLSRSQAYLNL
jgi:uncharacterized membrane protein YvbJ